MFDLLKIRRGNKLHYFWGAYPEWIFVFHILVVWALLNAPHPVSLAAVPYFWAPFPACILVAIVEATGGCPLVRRRREALAYWIGQIGFPIFMASIFTRPLIEIAKVTSETRGHFGYAFTGRGGDLGFQVSFVLTAILIAAICSLWRYKVHYVRCY